MCTVFYYYRPFIPQILGTIGTHAKNCELQARKLKYQWYYVLFIYHLPFSYGFQVLMGFVSEVSSQKSLHFPDMLKLAEKWKVPYLQDTVSIE